jgi:hypothetical protein
MVVACHRLEVAKLEGYPAMTKVTSIQIYNNRNTPVLPASYRFDLIDMMPVGNLPFFIFQVALSSQNFVSAFLSRFDDFRKHTLTAVLF